MSETQDIFKVALLSPDVDSYSLINNEQSIFGYEFSRSYTQTQGASFAFAHFNVDFQRLTAQFWALDGGSQWSTVRNLYLKKTSGLILLINPEVNGWKDSIHKLIVEFVMAVRYAVPMLILTNCKTQKQEKNLLRFRDSIERWSGIDVPLVHLENDPNASKSLQNFMNLVKNWRANTVVFQTLKLYFSFDSVVKETREISDIIKHLRKIYISRYIRLVDDVYLKKIILKFALKSGFSVENEIIQYRRLKREEPHEFLLPLSLDEELRKPKVKKV